MVNRTDPVLANLINAIPKLAIEIAHLAFKLQFPVSKELSQAKDVASDVVQRMGGLNNFEIIKLVGSNSPPHV